MLKTRSVDNLMPYVRYLALKLKRECAKEGIPLGIANTLRDKEYQEDCYKNGKSATKDLGPHAFGMAFDFFVNKKGKEYDPKLINRIGQIGKSLGLTWAGDWKTFKESVHFEYTGGLTAADLRAGKRVELLAVPTDLIDADVMAIHTENGDFTGYAVGGVTYAPVRAIAEAIGCEVKWDKAKPYDVEIVRGK